jgi:D-alanine-D-alanine ligase-like ATP-grasp enzyme
MTTMLTVEDVLQDAKQLPLDQRRVLIERLITSLQPPALLTPEDIESACGILQATHHVSLEQMEMAIRQRGGRI